MTDREKVIKGLECCTKKICIYKDTEKECPYWELSGEYEDSFEDCTTALSKDALALLKAQEPRVMTFGEISSINGGDLVWIEDRSLNEMIPGLKYQSPSKNCYYVILIGSKRPQPFSKELYEVNWRCWTSRPTNAQREVTPWE